MIKPDLTMPLPAELGRLHFTGIGGSGMSGIARLFLDAGYTVTGSDLRDTDAVRELRAAGATVAIGHDAARGTPVRGPVVTGVLVATAGAVVVGGVDVSISGRALAGDALALVGSVAVAAYALIGGRVRRRMPTSTYTASCYATAALALLVAAVVAGQPLGGYAARQWLGLVALTATAQLLGHSVFNHLLATVSAAVVSLALLLEIPGAALIAAAWLGQVPSPAAFAGLVLILVGMAVVVRSMPGPELPATAPA